MSWGCDILLPPLFFPTPFWPFLPLPPSGLRSHDVPPDAVCRDAPCGGGRRRRRRRRLLQRRPVFFLSGPSLVLRPQPAALRGQRPLRLLPPPLQHLPAHDVGAAPPPGQHDKGALRRQYVAAKQRVHGPSRRRRRRRWRGTLLPQWLHDRRQPAAAAAAAAGRRQRYARGLWGQRCDHARVDQRHAVFTQQQPEQLHEPPGVDQQPAAGGSFCVSGPRRGGRRRRRRRRRWQCASHFHELRQRRRLLLCGCDGGRRFCAASPNDARESRERGARESCERGSCPMQCAGKCSSARESRKGLVPDAMHRQERAVRYTPTCFDDVSRDLLPSFSYITPESSLFCPFLSA